MFYKRYMSRVRYDEIVASIRAKGEDGYPHCNSEVLHAPGTCPFCDGYPKRQQMRIAGNTPFTPAEANGWGGNMAPVVDDEKSDEEDRMLDEVLDKVMREREELSKPYGFEG